MKNILIVDDSPTVRHYHTCIITAGGYAAVSAIDGSDGLEKLYSQDIAFVLTDLNMGVMDGYEFIRRVRTDDKFKSLPIAIVTTEKGEKDKTRGYEAGANVYLVKPCEPEDILEQIRVLLEN